MGEEEEEVEEIPEPKVTVKQIKIEVTTLEENMKKKRKDQVMLTLMMVFISTGILMYFAINLWQEKQKKVEKVT